MQSPPVAVAHGGLDAGQRAGWSVFAGYMAYNILRKTWPSAIAQPSFTSALSITKGQIGSVSSLHGMAYGAAKFGGAVLSDRLSAAGNSRAFVLGLGMPHLSRGHISTLRSAVAEQCCLTV